MARVTIENAAKLNTLDSHLMIAFVGEVETLAQARRPARRGADRRRGVKPSSAARTSSSWRRSIPSAREGFITLVHRTCNALRELPVPVIARINGYALGAGLEVAAACDLRIASSNAVFGMPEVKVGIPSVVEAALLPGLIGWGRTRELLLWGENIDAQTALAWGFVEQVVEPARTGRARSMRASMR